MDTMHFLVEKLKIKLVLFMLNWFQSYREFHTLIEAHSLPIKFLSETCRSLGKHGKIMIQLNYLLKNIRELGTGGHEEFCSVSAEVGTLYISP